MRCKIHPADLSCTVGVCASCLRERLVVIIAAQADQQGQSSRAGREDRRYKPDPNPHPPPLVFPRSVSPYVSRRKSDDSAWHNNLRKDQLFFSTPQVGPTYSAPTTGGDFGDRGWCKKKKSKFSLLSNLFRPRSKKPGPDSDHRFSSPNSGETSTSSSSWFPNILPGRRKNQWGCPSEVSVAVGRKPCRRQDRGMSPEKSTDLDAECDDRSPSASGYSSESSQGWRRTPMVAPPSSRRGRQGHGRNVTGLAFCLSPLVRASPSHHWHQKNLPQEMGISGEIRVPAKPHLSSAASFCANRSRKLVDLGRVNQNR